MHAQMFGIYERSFACRTVSLRETDMLSARSAISVNNRISFQCYSVLICSHGKAHQGSQSLVKQLLTVNITHLSKFVVNLNLDIMLKPPTHLHFQGAFYFLSKTL